MLEPANSELTELATAYVDACLARDPAFVDAHSLDDPHGSFGGIGTPPGELFSRDVLIEHLPSLPQVRLLDSAPSGWVDGDVAWLTDFPRFSFPNGEAHPHRVTLVLRRVGGNWKVVHFHLSEGTDIEACLHP